MQTYDKIEVMHKDIAFWCTDVILHKKALTVFLCTGMFLDSEPKQRDHNYQPSAFTRLVMNN